jgi:hypothetical protein
MPRDRYPASPLARWLLPNKGLCRDLQKTHVTWPLPTVVGWRHRVAYQRFDMRSRRKQSSCIIGRVCVATVAQQWIHMSQYIGQYIMSPNYRCNHQVWLSKCKDKGKVVSVFNQLSITLQRRMSKWKYSSAILDLGKQNVVLPTEFKNVCNINVFLYNNKPTLCMFYLLVVNLNLDK